MNGLRLTWSSLSFIQNGKFLIVHGSQSQGQSGYIDSNLKDQGLNVDQLSWVELGRCGSMGCTTPGAMYTDYNVWLGELSEKELIDWTSCL